MDFAPSTTGDTLPAVLFDNHPRLLGCLPPRPGFGALPGFADQFQALPRADWWELDRGGLPVPILDQNGFGSCVGNGAAGALMRARALAGMPPQTLSAAFVYAQINGGRDAGAVISDALTVLQATGTCLASQVPESMIDDRQIPPEARRTARRFRVATACHARTFDELVSGILLGGVAVYGIFVGADFPRLDAEGIAPAHPGRVGNHCMHGDGVARSRGGDWLIANVNSWGTGFGRAGRCYLSQRHFAGTDPDAFLIFAAQEDPEDAPDLPPALMA